MKFLVNRLLLKHFVRSIFSPRPLLLALLTTSSAFGDGASLSNWRGEYLYKESFYDGKQSVITEIKLSISNDGNCRITWNGFQTNKDIICTASIGERKNEINIDFFRFSSGTVENEYGINQYSENERLVTLKNEHHQIRAVWGVGFNPFSTDNKKPYFIKLQTRTTAPFNKADFSQ
ncbi:DUF5991 domain-containing protein [Pseudomonas sp. CF161]|uniref:DUF5991 domain-containing protein n=1 Tax=Pseudomonas sp. CF161 TaxID=911241 RepID=UPI0012EB4360|nr:DUF5991 domain-containing protein [Pseudomonas sp. CF161]